MREEFIRLAAEQAELSVHTGDGGPFGAVIVKNGEIIAMAHNMVLATNDPTAHAEITALRAASAALGRYDLSDCEIYSSCEPCPMCLAAIYWAKIRSLCYGCTAEDAAEIGFDDKYIYDVLAGRAIDSRLSSERLERERCLKAFALWREKKDKKRY